MDLEKKELPMELEKGKPHDSVGRPILRKVSEVRKVKCMSRLQNCVNRLTTVFK